MEGRLFEDLVVSRGPGRSAGAGGMPFSMALHGAGLAGLLALSLVVPEALPVPPQPPIADVVFAAGPRVPTQVRVLQPSARTPRADRRTVAPVLEVPVEVRPIQPEAFAPDDDVEVGCVGCALRGGSPSGDPDDEPVGDGSRDGTGSTRTGRGPVRIGGSVQPPRKIRNVAPIYPELAKRAGVAGVVVLECVIDREGLIRSIQVVSGHPLLNEAAVSAVRQWAYRPTHLNGVPVEVIMTVTVRFTTLR